MLQKRVLDLRNKGPFDYNCKDALFNLHWISRLPQNHGCQVTSSLHRLLGLTACSISSWTPALIGFMGKVSSGTIEGDMVLNLSNVLRTF